MIGYFEFNPKKMKIKPHKMAVKLQRGLIRLDTH